MQDGLGRHDPPSCDGAGVEHDPNHRHATRARTMSMLALSRKNMIKKEIKTAQMQNNLEDGPMLAKETRKA